MNYVQEQLKTNKYYLTKTMRLDETDTKGCRLVSRLWINFCQTYLCNLPFFVHFQLPCTVPRQVPH